jgi:EmrB/QacA subfamily drug resistance transporter
MLGAVSAATFMLLLDVTVVNVALPDIQRTLHASFFDLQWVVDAYALTLAAFLLSAGTLADQFGRRRIFTYGLALFTVASLLCGLAPNPLVLNLARAVQGVGGAVMYAVAPAMIANDFHGRMRGVAFGISGGVTGLAVAIGPLLGGLLTAVSWRWVFLLNVPVGVAVTLVLLTRVGESRDPGRRRIDWPGVATFSTALTMLVFALIRGEQEGWTSPLIIGLFAGSGVLLGAFVLVERARRDPMFDLGLFRNLSFNGLSLSTLAINAAINVALLFQILYMQYVLGFSAFQTGLRYLPLTLVVFCAAAFAGALSARVPARLFLGLGSTALGIGLIVTGGLDLGSTWTDLLPGMIISGFGMGLFNPARAATAVALVPLARAGMSSGISETFQQGGVAVGVAALGSLAHSQIRDTVASTVAASGQFTAEQAHSIGALVSAGRVSEIAATVPAAQQPVVAAAANQALIDGLQAVLTTGGIVAIAGGLIGFLLVRGRDMHPDSLAPDSPAPDSPAVGSPAVGSLAPASPAPGSPGPASLPQPTSDR